jgi:geranylgeranyl pyrophosphate synthase
MIAFQQCADQPLAEAPRPAIEILPPVESGYLLAGFRRDLRLGDDLDSPLREMLEETLRHPGSLVRAQLAYPLLAHTAVGAARARSLAVAIEYFHTASLILDDLPSMDDAVLRRGRRCPHVEFGEATALLGALALINGGYSLVWSVIETGPAERRRRAADLVTEVLGVAGLLNGQSMDLGFRRGAGSGGRIAEIARRKTVPLLRMALVLPSILSRASDSEIHRLEALAEGWGMAYQLLDDFRDCMESVEESGKSTARDRSLGRPNLCDHLGPRVAAGRLSEALAGCRELLDAPSVPAWPHLEAFQELLEARLRGISARLGSVRLQPVAVSDRRAAGQ